MGKLSVALLLGIIGTMAFGADNTTTDKDKIHFVETFIETPTANLPPDAVPLFMDIDPKTLPPKLRMPCEAKQMEIKALQKVAEGKRKPPIRRYDMAEPKCDEPVKGNPRLLQAWKMARYVEATEDEIDMAMVETKCSECELETEFTLKRMAWEEPGKDKAKKTRIRYFFVDVDPVWFFIDLHRRNMKLTTGTPFFGVGGRPPQCH